jgi:hypothetical protein
MGSSLQKEARQGGFSPFRFGSPLGMQGLRLTGSISRDPTWTGLRLASEFDGFDLTI